MKKSDDEEPLETISVRLYASDLRLLRTVHDRFGYNRVVRQLVHNYCLRLEQRLKLQELADADTE